MICARRVRHYVITNIRSTFASSRVVACQQFPMHRFTNTFDDVIDTAVAIGAIGSGTASLVLRGGVDA